MRLLRLALVAVLAVLVVSALGCATPVGQRDPIGNPRLERITSQELATVGPAGSARLSADDLVRLTQQGVSPDQIIDRFYRSGSRLKLTGVQIADLRHRGIDQRVIDYVVSHEREAEKIDAITGQADREAQARARAERVYRHDRYYDPYLDPYPYSYPYYWGPQSYPYLGYRWSGRGSGWYGGVGIGF